MIKTVKGKVAKQENKKMTKTKELEISLDYPREGERVTGLHYSFRIQVLADAEQVEVSIDHGPWESCRQAAGCWWYDWTGYPEGNHQAVVRMKTKDGRTLNSQSRQFEVAQERPRRSLRRKTGSYSEAVAAEDKDPGAWRR